MSVILHLNGINLSDCRAEEPMNSALRSAGEFQSASEQSVTSVSPRGPKKIPKARPKRLCALHTFLFLIIQMKNHLAYIRSFFYFFVLFTVCLPLLKPDRITMKWSFLLLSSIHIPSVYRRVVCFLRNYMLKKQKKMNNWSFFLSSCSWTHTVRHRVGSIALELVSVHHRIVCINVYQWGKMIIKFISLGAFPRDQHKTEHCVIL